MRNKKIKAIMMAAVALITLGVIKNQVSAATSEPGNLVCPAGGAPARLVWNGSRITPGSGSYVASGIGLNRVSGFEVTLPDDEFAPGFFLQHARATAKNPAGALDFKLVSDRVVTRNWGDPAQPFSVSTNTYPEGFREIDTIFLTKPSYEGVDPETGEPVLIGTGDNVTIMRWEVCVAIGHPTY